MSKSINVTNARALRKTLQDVVDKYENKQGNFRKQKGEDLEQVVKEVVKKITDLAEI